MHKSRLQTLVIDCETDDLDSDAAFWGLHWAVKCLPTIWSLGMKTIEN